MCVGVRMQARHLCARARVCVCQSVPDILYTTILCANIENINGHGVCVCVCTIYVFRVVMYATGVFVCVCGVFC